MLCLMIGHLGKLIHLQKQPRIYVCGITCICSLGSVYNKYLYNFSFSFFKYNNLLFSILL